MGKRALLVCLLALLLAAPAAAERPRLRVGTSGDYAPFSVAAPATPGAYAGFDVALARAYAEERGLAVELVPFRWPELVADLRAGRFDVAMSGVTVRPERSVAGRFSVAVAESGAVVLVRDDGRFDSLEALDRRGVRIAVNAGGHLERAAGAHFQRATLVSIADNEAVLAALESLSVDAVVSDTLEAPLWRARAGDLVQFGPFTRDRKACLVREDRGELAADLDGWLLARERDGTLGRLRREYLGAGATPTATPLMALVAAMDERLALMPWVVAAKRRDVRPISDPAREKKVIEAGVAAARAAAERARVEPPPEPALRAFFRAQIDAAVQVQVAVGRAPEPLDEASAPDLERELRPALLRIGERMAPLLLLLPPDLDAAAVDAALRQGLRSPWLSDASRDALARAVLGLLARPAEPAREQARQDGQTQ
jgi:cyclohexadienyl dehydratase